MKVCLSACEVNIVNSCNVTEAINSGLKLADSIIRQQTILGPIVNDIRFKRSVGKGFTDFLIYINVFLKAFEEDIPLKKSQKQSITDELKDSIVPFVGSLVTQILSQSSRRPVHHQYPFYREGLRR